MTSFIFFLLAGLFVWRVTHLIIDDAILMRPVNWLVYGLFKGNKYLEKLFTCYYCMGFWVSLITYGAIVGFTDYFPVNNFFEHIILIGALAGFPPLIQEFIPEE